MSTWPTTVFACPALGPEGALRVEPAAGWWCDASELAYPLLGGCPILVPDPARFVGEHREAVLAALAEHGLADGPTVARVRALAEPWLDRAPEPLRDDWTLAEEQGRGAVPRPIAGPAADAIDGLRRLETEQGAIRRVREEVAAAGPATIVEIGPGAGLLSAELALIGQRLAVVDRSLRAVLVARERARAQAGADVVGVVADAEQLAFRPSSVDALVTANLLDLLDEPERLLEAAAVGLRRGGVFVASTPRPSLRRGEPDDALAAAIADAGLQLARCHDGLPWLRAHSARELQVFSCQVVVATKV